MVQVLLWDERLHPTRGMSQLQGPQNLEGFVSVRMTDDGRAVIAGTVCGQVTHKLLQPDGAFGLQKQQPLCAMNAYCNHLGFLIKPCIEHQSLYASCTGIGMLVDN